MPPRTCHSFLGLNRFCIFGGEISASAKGNVILICDAVKDSCMLLLLLLLLLVLLYSDIFRCRIVIIEFNSVSPVVERNCSIQRERLLQGGIKCETKNKLNTKKLQYQTRTTPTHALTRAIGPWCSICHKGTQNTPTFPHIVTLHTELIP